MEKVRDLQNSGSNKINLNDFFLSNLNLWRRFDKTCFPISQNSYKIMISSSKKRIPSPRNDVTHNVNTIISKKIERDEKNDSSIEYL